MQIADGREVMGGPVYPEISGGVAQARRGWAYQDGEAFAPYGGAQRRVDEPVGTQLGLATLAGERLGGRLGAGDRRGEHRLCTGPLRRAGVGERPLHDFLATLTEDQRLAFALAEIEGLRATEIAEQLGINLNTLYSRLQAARKQFAQFIAAARGTGGRDGSP